MPTAVIAEDEPLLADVLREHLADVWPELSVAACATDGDMALSTIRALHPDVAFLDIRMPGLSGLQVARHLLDDAHVPVIVFVTAYDQYALDAFDAAAVDYLLKPVARERLSRCAERVRQRLAQAPPAALGTLLEQLQAHLGGAGGVAEAGRAAEAPARAARLRFIRASLGEVTRQIPIEDVLYFDAQDKYVAVVTRDGSALVRTALTDLLAALDPERFTQIHRSTIVNLDAIDTIRRDISGRVFVHLKGAPGGRDTRLPVSRQFAGQFRGM